MSELTREGLLEFLLSKSEPITESGCLIWNGVIHPDGYAMQSLSEKNMRVHRTVFELTHGPIPIGLVPDHLCRVRCCINPNRIESVTNKVNVLRGDGPTAKNARKTHCVNGHPLTQENLGSYGKKGTRFRRCKKCAVIRQTRYEQRKKVDNG